MIGGLVLVRSVAAYVPDVRVPDALPLVAAAGVLVAAAIFASLMPALRASRVDVVQALRSE
jgi:ABC-type lipoprotein release transport system permease subunit